jgi:hypothetical protein
VLIKHSTELNQFNSHLLRLPAELRNRIYEFAFSATTVKVHLDTTGEMHLLDSPMAAPARHAPQLQQETNLLLVCRQIHHEAFDIFYKTCRLDFGDGFGTWGEWDSYQFSEELQFNREPQIWGKATLIQIGRDIWCYKEAHRGR